MHPTNVPSSDALATLFHAAHNARSASARRSSENEIARGIELTVNTALRLPL